MFRRRLLPNPPTVVGLELDPSHLAAAEVVVNGHLAVRRSAVAMLRPGILRDGELSEPDALTDALRELFDGTGLPTRVRLGVAHQRIVVRTMELPPLSDERAVAAAVRAQAPDHIPMPMDEAVLDFQPLGLVETPQGKRFRVVIVAVRREMVERLAEAVMAAGLEIEGIDLSAFAMVRALGRASPGARLYVNLAGLTNMAVAGTDAVLFARTAPGGTEAMVHVLAERRSLTLDHARQWMAHVGMVAPLEHIEGDADLVASTRAVLEEGVQRVADAIRGSVEYYRTQENAEPVEEGLLTGPAVGIPGFSEALGAELGLPMNSAMVDPEDAWPDEAQPSRLSVAAGLALAQRELPPR